MVVFLISGVHIARVHDEEVWWNTNSSVSSIPVPHSLHLHQDIGMLEQYLNLFQFSLAGHTISFSRSLFDGISYV